MGVTRATYKDLHILALEVYSETSCSLPTQPSTKPVTTLIHLTELPQELLLLLFEEPLGQCSSNFNEFPSDLIKM